MICPNCGEKLRVLVTIPTDQTTERYRQCPACEYSCHTTEAKSDGKEYRKLLRERYAKEKLNDL